MRRTVVAMVSVLGLLGLAACSGQAAPVASDRTQVIQAALSEGQANPQDVTAVAGALNAFAVDLYRELSKEQPGEATVFVSPASIQQVLLLLLAGTDGRVSEDLRKVLHLDLPDERLYPAVAALWQQMADRGYTFDNANWGIVRDTVPLEPTYRDLTAQYLGADIRPDSFADPEALAQQINDAVKERTAGMIEKLIEPEMLENPDLFLVLLNAVHFKGDWVDPFTEPTYPAPFTTWDGTRTEVPTMTREGVTSYVTGDGYTAIRLPYAGGAAMTVVLPDAGQFDAVADRLDATNWADLSSTLRFAASPAAILRLPKVSFGMSKPLDLKPAITALGGAALFAPSTDWQPLTGDAEQPVDVDFLIHKAALEVDEKGTEAAAATGGGVEATSARPDLITITVDRPFLLTIADDETGAILFLGQVGDPQV